MPTIHRLARLLTCSCLLLIAACSSVGSPGQLAKDWSCKIREMQIRPLFPPREDFHVGDIYLLETVGKDDAEGYCNSQKSGFYGIPMHVAYLPELNQQAAGYYGSRPDFPRTTTSNGTVTVTANGLTITSGAQTTDVTQGSSTFFTKGKADRTMLVGFPDFMSVKVDKFSLGAIIPIQGMFTPFGLSTEDVDEASISIPVAESYGVPMMQALNATRNVGTTTLCDMQDFIKNSTAASGTATNGTATSAQLHLVTEVYYTRAIDVNIQSKSAVALGIARDRSTGSNTSTAVASIGLGSSTAAVSPTTTLQQMAANVAGGVVQILGARSALPGVSLNYEQSRSSTITMRRIFDRPVAIGYRSMAMGIESNAAGCGAELKAGGTTGTGAPAPATVPLKIRLRALFFGGSGGVVPAFKALE